MVAVLGLRPKEIRVLDMARMVDGGVRETMDCSDHLGLVCDLGIEEGLMKSLFCIITWYVYIQSLT
jgi:hypothetical protein